MADLSLVVLPRSRELGRLMEEHQLKKTILTCAHHAALRTCASAPSRASACRRFKRSKLQKKTLCEVLKKLVEKYGKLATPVRSTRLPIALPRGEPPAQPSPAVALAGVALQLDRSQGAVSPTDEDMGGRHAREPAACARRGARGPL